MDFSEDLIMRGALCEHGWHRAANDAPSSAIPALYAEMRFEQTDGDDPSDTQED